MENMNTKFNVIDYISMVNALVKNFFDDDGTYTPQMGRINAMVLFYENCMADFAGVTYNIEDMADVNKLLDNEEFVKLFNKAIEGDGYERLDFSCAYADAMDIVNTKKQSFGNVMDVLKNVLNEFGNKMAPIMEGLDVDKLMQIADKVSNGEATADAIVNAYANNVLKVKE